MPCLNQASIWLTLLTLTPYKSIQGKNHAHRISERGSNRVSQLSNNKTRHLFDTTIICHHIFFNASMKLAIQRKCKVGKEKMTFIDEEFKKIKEFGFITEIIFPLGWKTWCY